MYRRLEGFLGRTVMARCGRFLSNRARLDLPNGIGTNGELLVIDAALRRVSRVGTFTALDIGANTGEWTTAVADAALAANAAVRIFAFEPVTATREILKQQIERLSAATITVVDVGLSNRAGPSPMFIVGETAGTNSLHAGESASFKIETVEIDTVDNFCGRSNLRHVDLMKVDAEGHDMRVLEGAERMLTAGSIDFVQFEYNHRWIFARQFLRDAFTFLGSLGYSIGKVTPFGIEGYESWHPELESFREGNYLAHRKGLPLDIPIIQWWHQE